jgi:hypothetical protein
MATERRLKGLGSLIGLFSCAVLLGIFMRASTVSAQCGPAGPNSAKNTACGTGALTSNTTGANESAFGFDALLSNTTGLANTAYGAGALLNNTTGNGNTASGTGALLKNTFGGGNTASGDQALQSNTTGDGNTASGAHALRGNTTGGGNTASGANALLNNTTGGGNTASGANALLNNTTGFENTASGANALLNDTMGGDNTASGYDALTSNTTGSGNTASGDFALVSNTMGNDNIAIGDDSLNANSMGSDNIAIGATALTNNTTGNDNIAIGMGAAEVIQTGSGNIDIGSYFSQFDESDTIRIGNSVSGPPVQNTTFIAGISGTPVTGDVVEVNSLGQLGIATSSARYKHDIRDMGGASGGLMKLRPVTFRYKNDPSGTLEYGLVAEEVQRVYPNLVTHGPDGKLQSVRYLELTALLLNELQKQAAKVAAQQRAIDALKQQNASLNRLSERLAVLEHQVQTASSQGLRSLASK